MMLLKNYLKNIWERSAMVKNEKDVLRISEFNNKIDVVESFVESFQNGDMKIKNMKIEQSRALTELIRQLSDNKNKTNYGLYLLIAEELYTILMEYRIQGMILGKFSDDQCKKKLSEVKIENIQLKKDNVKFAKIVSQYEDMKFSYNDRKKMK